MKTSDSNNSKALVVPSILVADDDRALRLLMCKMLELIGFKVDQAEDGIEAVRQFENNRYCLVFMDIHMPEKDGFQATQEIRKTEAPGTRIPIIALTAITGENPITEDIAGNIQKMAEAWLNWGKNKGLIV